MDHDAFAELVRRHQHTVVAYAYARLGDRHLAEDAAQEAFVEAYRSLAKLRDPQAFGAWLRKIAFTQCDRITRGRGVRVVALSEAAELAAPEPDADDVREIREAVRSLPEREREVTSLYYLAGLSQAEVASFLGLPVTTVNNRLHAARRRLERSLMDRFTQRVLRTIAPDREADTARILAALDAQYWRDGRLADSTLDWEASRIGVLDGEVVAICGVYDLTMRIGPARVRTAGINVTYGERFAETAAAADASLRDRGYDLAVTFGKPAMPGYTPRGASSCGSCRRATCRTMPRR